jgi:hypothetical protein
MDRNDKMGRQKRVITLIGIFSFLLQACTGEGPAANDVVGIWKSLDGAVLNFSKDGSFDGENLPAQYFTFSTSKSNAEGRKIKGHGKWELQNEAGSAEIKLHFQIIDNNNITGLYSVLIAGEHGILDNKPPWYLFVWEEEEGGERYKFKKQ